MYMFMFLMTILVVVLASEEKYSNKYDKLNIDEILHNERLLVSNYKCLMDTGPCTPEGNELKKVIPEALTNECAKCSEFHKETTEKVIKFLSKEQHEMWEELEKKYDPENVYRKKYGELAHEHDIDI